MSKPTMRPRMHHVIARPLLACVLAATCGMAAASPDQERLRLLSCDLPSATGGKAAIDWFNATAEALSQDRGHRIAGPITLGKACLQNVDIAGAFGVVMVEGDICNARLDDFTEALAAAGTTLGKDVEEGQPEMVLGMRGADRGYLVTRGRFDSRTGKMGPGTTPYSFSCMAAQGGPQ